MIDPNSLKVTELRAELTARGLSTKGLKKDLVARLEEALATEGTTAAPAESNSEPDVAPKESNPEHEDQNTNMDTIPPSESSTASEAREISKIVEPIAEPMSAPVEPVVMTEILEPATVQEDVSESTAATIEPVIGTPSLSQEGFIDTTTTLSSPSKELTKDSKKRSRESEDSSSEKGPVPESVSATKEKPPKRIKAIEIDREQSDLVAAATRDSLEADARRRSFAPSPSPVVGRAGFITSAPVVPIIAEEGSKQLSESAAKPLDHGVKAEPIAERKMDAMAIIDRQMRLAAKSLRPEQRLDEPTSSVTADVLPEAMLPQGTTRALAISNFVRPLTVPQVKRMLSEFGEVEVLWMDNIRTHCYVTFKETESAERAYSQVKGQVFPKETGKPLEPHFITPEAAAKSIARAEEAQKKGERAIVYTGEGAPVVLPKRGAPITVQKDDVAVIFKREIDEQSQVVQPTELFMMTRTQPSLYYKLGKEFTSVPVKDEVPVNDEAPATSVTATGEPTASEADSMTSAAVAAN
ncbi:hypothetical protein B0O80DRAFT_530748 [Mortierella sp. GBAus27b]|nr:hypothetical protein B0O80DRAFT_530748 [Mortierella sp. GBAus27b]